MPALKVFISYSSADESLRKELDRHLSLLKREGVIETWTFREIEAGDDWRSEINDRLEAADIVILLVSADFVASDYCWNIEMRRALQRHREGSARVVPVIVRECDWSSAPFAGIQALPPTAKPVTSTKPRDKAWTTVVEGIRKVAASLGGKTQKESQQPQPESALQRAQRLAADSRARKSHEEKLRTQGHAAFTREVEIVFRELEDKAKEIRQATPELKLEAGWRRDHCIVRFTPLRQNMYPLTLHLYPHFEGIEVEKSHLTVRLLHGGMTLPQESGKYYMEKPREHSNEKWFFRLTAEGEWRWESDTTGRILNSSELAEQLLSQLLQLHDDVETGKVTQPNFEDMWR